MKILLIFLSVLIYANTIKCVSTASWPPFNTIEDGKLAGISYDYWKLIAKKLNLQYRCVIVKNWHEVLDSIKNKKYDITIGTGKTQERLKYAIFSKPYATFPVVIATKNDIGYIASMNFLKNRVVAVGKDYTVTELIKKKFPYLKIVEAKNIKEALEMVRDNRAFAAIDILPVLAYYINKYEFANLKIAGKTPLVFKMRFMLRDDLIDLRDKIDKAIDTISNEEKREIFRKWVAVRMESGFNVKVVMGIVGFLIFVILLVLVWVFKLRKLLTEQENTIKIFENLSTIDPLTKAHNRRKIDNVLKFEIEKSKYNNTPFSVIFFDIDDFKKINDTYGHSVGDEVLKKVSELVRTHIRKSDFFGRWGGEEFIILLSETDIKEAHTIAEKLRKLINSYKFKIGNVSASFGVTFLREGESITDLMIRADNYMYEAKKRGKNRVISDLNI